MLKFGEYLFMSTPSGIFSSNFVLFSREINVSNLRNLSSVMKDQSFFCLCFTANLCLICQPIFAILLMSCSRRSSFVGNLGRTFLSWTKFWPLIVWKTRLNNESVITTSFYYTLVVVGFTVLDTFDSFKVIAHECSLFSWSVFNRCFSSVNPTASSLIFGLRNLDSSSFYITTFFYQPLSLRQSGFFRSWISLFTALCMRQRSLVTFSTLISFWFFSFRQSCLN